MAKMVTLTKVAGGTMAAGLAALTLGSFDVALAAKKKAARQLAVQTINVRDASRVPSNEVIEIAFTAPVDPASVSPATVQIREERTGGGGFTKQVFGSFQVAGRVVRFFPRLPTHLRDANGRFYPEGHALDNAADNAGFRPATRYEVRVVGRPFVSPVMAANGRPLRRTASARFSTAPATFADELWTTRTYRDSPPPQFSFSNPPDKTPSPDDLYTKHGGTHGVPNEVAVSLFCTKVPLSPQTTRISGNIELTLTERKGNSALRRPVRGTVYVEQNFETTLLVYQPQVALADQGVYALRVAKHVRDLTEQHDFEANRQRERLRAIYDWLSTERAQNPGAPASAYDDPPSGLIPDWPETPSVRDTLKANLLALGDARPDEIDPRVMVLFTTQDEPVTEGTLVLDFLKSDNRFDPGPSTADWDGPVVPGAAAAVLTIAGGTGVNGDFQPTGSQTINIDSYPNRTINWRRVRIPQGTIITVVGTRAATIKAYDIQVDGVIQADGAAGETNTTNTANQTTTTSTTKPTVRRGGAGGPGGGKGGDTSDFYYYTNYNTYEVASNPGVPGVDESGVTLAPADGGRGGLGGGTSSGTYYKFGGGGGGGGARLAGANGNGTAYYAAWDGPGGNGGAGSTNEDLTPLGGGAGGGSGGNSAWNSGTTAWANNGGGGGGGGGALLIQTAGVFTVGTTGNIRARGGVGGNGPGSGSYTTPAGAGGGGGGGSVLLRSTKGFNLANAAAAVDVRGGNGGTTPASGSPTGGAGGAGYLRLEDPDGGLLVPGGTRGVFDPVGGGVPSLVYSRFMDLDVADPRLVPWKNSDVATEATLNDAIYVEAQMTREDPRNFGVPDLTALNALGNSTNTTVTSQWHPVKIHDNTGKPGGAFNVPGWIPAVHGKEFSGFPVAPFNDKGYKFIRFRITFQLDDFQSRTDPMPFVDHIITTFQFNH